MCYYVSKFQFLWSGSNFFTFTNFYLFIQDFGIDQDGKKNPWEAVVLLDFIDEKKLLAAEVRLVL